MIKLLWALIVLTFLIAFVPFVFSRARHLGYSQGCYDGVTSTLQGFKDAGVNFTTQTDPKNWCEQEWKENNR